MNKKIALPELATEQVNPNTLDLDTCSPRRIAQKINREDFQAARAVKEAHKEIAAVMLAAAQAYANGHKIIFIGAGTSGRLGILEAAECVPTFSTKPSRIIGLIAGGKKAVFRSQEGAEDNRQKGAEEIKRHAQKGDLVIGLSASGRTPYVTGALEQAQKTGARTAFIFCNKNAVTAHADLPVYLPTGPEALTGSTRMKAGTATKMALNAITTGAMTLCGKTYRNLMVDVQATNQKLITRAIGLICQIAQTDPQTAARLLRSSGKNVKTAVVMYRKKVTRQAAEKLLKKHNGFLTEALHD